MNEHSCECIEAFHLYKTAKEIYESMWPNYCRKCGGGGVFGWNENQAPLGSGYYWPEYFEEPCEECTEKSICARCGESGLTPEEGEGPCKFCGWNYNDSCPGEPECFCWMIKEKKKMRQPWSLTIRPILIMDSVKKVIEDTGFKIEIYEDKPYAPNYNLPTELNEPDVYYVVNAEELLEFLKGVYGKQ